MDRIPFNRPHATGREFDHIRKAIDNGHLSGGGRFAQRCEAWLETRTGTRRALLTPSCSSALEFAALLAGIGPGDEVVMPSFTFVTTASAVVLRGGVPVFVDVRPDTLNLDESLLEDAVTPRTKAVFAVHYAGVGCEMHAVRETAASCGAMVVEDAAQGVMASFRGHALGSIGDLGCISFHETKNVICGEGGALLVNDEQLIERAEILHEKGTNRTKFMRGEVDRYTWVDLGSSFMPSEVAAAFLWAQLESADEITAQRLAIWRAYHDRFEALEEREAIRRPIVPDQCSHNAHMYYLLLPDRQRRDRVIARLADAGIEAVFHYVPLHSSPAGRRYGRAATPMDVTDSASDRLVRLPLWIGLTDTDIDRICRGVENAIA
ncbi:MAG: dTDP-4-amino-4,6-dideoxygalactose transaminase [Actinobacteria bacterium]|nr:dTDP-4-amino-4,6-dideoxygalactose transaminase [Actinomycetota bacterium]